MGGVEFVLGDQRRVVFARHWHECRAGVSCFRSDYGVGRGRVSIMGMVVLTGWRKMDGDF